MNSLTLRGVAAEIQALRGRRLEGVDALDARTLRFRLGDGDALWISVHPRHPSVFLAPEREEAAPPLAIPFLHLVTSALEGGRLAGAAQAGLDRVVAVTFQLRDRLGDVTHRHLVAELTGSAANLLLVEGEEPWSGRILGRLRSEGSERGARRAGSLYALPISAKPDVTRADDALLLAAAAQAISTHGHGPKALVQAWMGVSPAVAREILRRAPDPMSLQNLVSAWRDLSDATRPGGAGSYAPSAFAPTLATRKDGTEEVQCFAPHSDPNEGNVRFASLSEALAAAFHRFRIEEMARGRSVPLRALLTVLDRVERGLAAVDREEQEAGSALTLRRTGEAVLSHAHGIPRGVAEAEIPDPRTGEPIRVRLNPRLSAGENADLLFKKARKAERREPALIERRKELRRQRAALIDLRNRLEGSAEGEPDAQWIREAEALGVRFPREEVATAAKTDPEDRLPASLRPRRYDLGGGWQALVGKSNRGNDVLTLELARPDDTWMHANQAAGSHLVLRHHEKGKEVPQAVLLVAAAIAAYFSKARGSSKVPVLISQKRHVRKPRKAPVGTVTVSRYETVMVEPRCPDEGVNG